VLCKKAHELNDLGVFAPIASEPRSRKGAVGCVVGASKKPQDHKLIQDNEGTAQNRSEVLKEGGLP
jgi:hypothetical protein